MQVHKLEDDLWVVRQGQETPMPFSYASRETALLAQQLPAAKRWALQRAADCRADGGAGVISYLDVVAAISAWRS
jgi:hypothetical protein